MHRMITGMFVFVVLPFLLNANGRPELVAKGHDEYARGNYEKAYEFYLNAGVSDPEVSFKLASIISYFRKQGLVCEYNAYVDIILEELQYAIAQDSSLLDKVLSDTAFSPIHRTALYNIWQGHSLDNDTSIAYILTEVTWYRIVEPITATGGKIVFQADNSVFVDWGIYYEYDEVMGAFTPCSYGKQQGQYTVTGRKIFIQWNKTYGNYYNADMQKESVFILELDGVSGVLKDEDSKRVIFYDMPDECNT